MIEINLREFYPECYRSDYFVEVPDEVAELLILLRRHEQSQRRRIYKHKAHYSLDIYENVERETMLKSPSAEEVFEHKVPHFINRHPPIPPKKVTNSRRIFSSRPLTTAYRVFQAHNPCGSDEQAANGAAQRWQQLER